MWLIAWLALAPVGAAERSWRTPDPTNTVYLNLDDGVVIIELNPTFAPGTVAQFKKLVRAGFYDRLSFYRVIDGFVAQGGDGNDLAEGEPKVHPTLAPEFETTWLQESKFVSVQKPDLFAPETGFVDGFAVARDRVSQRQWLTHCPGVVAMARGNDPASGSTDFYIVIGQAPRYLDRNLTIFGRVIWGMPIVQRIRRGQSEANGVIDDESARTIIRSIRVAGDLPESDRMRLQVMDTAGAEFAETLRTRKHRTNAFFHHRPPSVLDVCQVPVAVRVAP